MHCISGPHQSESPHCPIPIAIHHQGLDGVSPPLGLDPIPYYHKGIRLADGQDCAKRGGRKEGITRLVSDKDNPGRYSSKCSK